MAAFQLRLSLCLSAISAVLLAQAAISSKAQAPPPVQHPSAAFRESLDTILNKRTYAQQYPAGSQWLDGGSRYTALEDSATNPKQQDLVAYTTATGQRTILVPAARFIPTGAARQLDIDSYTWSTDKKQLLLFTDTKRVWRRNTRGDYWVLNLDTGNLHKLGGDAKASSLMFAKFSPNGKSVGYVYANNLYVEDVATGQRRQLTSDGNTDIINGTSDWVSEEEFDIRDAFRWSPDGDRIAYLQFNQSGEGDYTLINDTKAEYPETFHYKYPQAGTTNAAVRIGVVDVSSAETKWLPLPGDPRQHYIPRFDWVGTHAPNELALEYMNRLQNRNDVYLFNTNDLWLFPKRSDIGRIVFTDTDAAWVDVVDQLRWLKPIGEAKGRDLLWLSERDGWRHAYRIAPDGKPHLLTDFAADVIELVAVDEPGGYLYFTASPTDPVRKYLYRARLDGQGKPERLTPESQPGFHNYEASPDGKVALHSWSTVGRPNRFELLQLAGGKVLKPLVSNNTLAEKVKALVGSGKEFIQVPVDDGVNLNGYVIKPPNFDPSKKYPVLVYVYGEPAEATVEDSWTSGEPIETAFANEGYVIVSFDNAGTPEPRGRTWRKSVYGSVGVLASQQQAAAIRAFARQNAWVDTTRLAVWGWSGGGSMTLNMMFRYPGLFRAGIAVAPVADQRKYDTIYQERYMGLPQDNAKGYHDGSPISYANGLAQSLLIVHGSGDDNVHFQATELLVNKLIELGKSFDFMDYPNRTHGIYEGKGTTTHLYTLLARYLEDHVPAGPQ
jgi:dipeptidyl-peptidase-4